MSDDQVESYDLQRQEYEDKVAQNKHWTLVDVYADEGISATSMKKRKDFNRLIGDCKAGKVSLVPVSYTHLDVYKRQVESCARV